MADTGYNWGTAAHATYSTGTDVDDIAVGDTAALTTDEISNDVKGSTEVSVKTIEDNTGATDGNVNVYVLGTDNDPDSEGWQDSGDINVMQFAIPQAQNATERLVFTVLGVQYSKFKVYVYNDCGQEVALTININQSTIPVAS